MEEPKDKFSDYEFWIFILTIFHSNQYTQSLSISQQQAMLQVIRKKHCPNITNEQWLNIELNIVNNRNIMMDSMLESASASAGMTDNILGIDEMAKFNYEFSQLDTFDFDAMKKQIKQNGIVNPRIDELFDF